MGNISVALPSDGETIDVADYNTPINTIVNEINGGLDNSNITAAAAIAGTKLANASVPAAKIDYSTVSRFSATKSSTQTAITANTLTTVAWQTEQYDVGNNFASNTFTVPTNGVYHFDANVRIAATTTGNHTGGETSLAVNGTVIRRGDSFFDNNISADYQAFGVNADLLLLAGDLVTVSALGFTSSGTTTFVFAADTYFNGHLVGLT